jgi:hypothetical protein
MMSSKTKSFVITLTASLALAVGCAWVFGLAVQDTYPEGILVFAPEPGQPDRPSDAFHIGLAMGSFFSGLIFATMTLCTFVLARMQHNALRHLLAPLSTATVMCLTATALGLYLSG